MSEIIFGQMGTDEENARYQEWRAKQLRTDRKQRLVTGDEPPKLTAEDERILDQVWREIAREDEEFDEQSQLPQS